MLRHAPRLGQVFSASIQIRTQALPHLSSRNRFSDPSNFCFFRCASTNQTSQFSLKQNTTAKDLPERLQEGENTVKTPVAKKEKLELGQAWRLISLAKPERKTIFTALSLLCISSTVSLSIPFGIGKIIDVFSGAEAAPPVSIPMAATGLTVIFGLGAAASAARIILMRIAAERLIARLRNDAYMNVLRQDIGWHDLKGAQPTLLSKDQASGKDASTEEGKSTEVKSTGDIISRLASDTGLVGHSLTRDLSDGARALVTATVGVGAMFFISSKLTFAMLFIVPPISIAAVYYGRFLKTLAQKTQKAVGDMVSVSEEKLGGIRTVQAFNTVETVEKKNFATQVEEVFQLSRKEAWATGIFTGTTGLAGNATLIGLLTYGGMLVSRGEITVGDLTSLMVYTFYIGSSLIGLTSFFGTLMRGLGASTRIFELLDARPVSVVLGRGTPLLPSTPAHPVVFDNVWFAYPSRPSVEILKGVNLTIQPGTIVSIAGGSGSGKSTIANLLVRYYDPVQGTVLYGEEDIRTYTPESWRDRVALVPQDPALFTGTIAENIAYGASNVTQAEIEEAADLANCGFIYLLPKGFETQVGSRGAQLSGGQRQRLAIARALVRKPKILVCDEATSALDAASETLINAAIKKISRTQSLTTILIAHRLSTIRSADVVVLMDNGVVAEQGSYSDLTQENTKFNELIKSQLGVFKAPSKVPPILDNQPEQRQNQL